MNGFRFPAHILKQQVGGATTHSNFGGSMKFRKSIALGAAAVTAASLGAAAVVGGTAAGASSRAGIPTVVVRMVNDHIKIDGGSTLHAGRINFKVVTGAGSHILQILRLHKGYTLQDAGPDFGKAFSGDLAAIHRLDTKVTWRGGATARPNNPGFFTVTLRHGNFYMLDQNGNGVTPFRVVGDPVQRPRVPHSSQITAFSYGFESDPETIPAAGTLYFFNQSDQPHFLDIHHVKEGTTRRDVTQALHSNGPPAIFLHGGTGAGVISPYFGQMMRYDLPPGEYLIACFWPASDTGMPHAFMGMFKLIHLK
ncbi:MAG: hypothetical protein QOJ34_1152 [Pseudonocardiales bacterium]|nr:hypothetical protein [Pseudonocardiales bacterium]